MKERPILFTGPMVRAILEGRKTQTRRIMKPQPDMEALASMSAPWRIGTPNEHATPVQLMNGAIATGNIMSPYGQAGDRLWVQEEHRIVKGEFNVCLVEYEAGGHMRTCLIDNRELKLLRARKYPFARTRGRFMYRSFSRITLEVTAGRVERLLDISPEDALAEGIDHYVPGVTAGQRGEVEADPIAEYRELWESINGPGSWAENPWVWVIEFRRLTP